jgi:hypothetical protein
LCIDYIYAASADLKRRKTEEQKGDRGKTRRNKEGFSLILKSLHWNVKEEKRKKEGEKDRQTAKKKNKKKQENTDSTSTSQLQRHCFRSSRGTLELFLGLLFHFLQNRIYRCFFPSAPAARTLGTLMFFSLLTLAEGKVSRP